MNTQFNHTGVRPGMAPGIEHEEIPTLPPGKGQVTITCVDYSPGQAAVQEVQDLRAFLGLHRPDWSAVRWISVVGLSDMKAIHALATKYNLHPLAVEDVLHTRQRPKIEAYGGGESELQARLFIVTGMLYSEAGNLQHEQLSIFLGHKTVLSFQESHAGMWDPLLQRIQMKGSRLRTNDASFLAYSLVDTAVDGCFPLLEQFGDRTEALEAMILENAKPDLLSEIHQLKRDLLLLRWVVWPMREVVQTLQRDPHECMSENSRVYLRDLYDHVIQLLEIIETYREIASDLTETYMSSVSNRMNEVMKVLTLIGTIFIPLTFLAGVYGMNFRYLPELGLRWAYPAFWVMCTLLAILMLFFFRRRKWL